MEHVRTFLESSSIHGLTHISRNRKFKQFFWILIVFVGFSSAFFLISSSFHSWNESPIKTTIETLPITDMKFPKVTVCPPKNTFTDLNYDLMMSEEKKLSDDKKKELYTFSMETVEDGTYTDALNQLQEKDRFYNWYNGFSCILPPGPKSLVQTYTLSGTVSTENFGEPFQPDLVRRNTDYRIYINPNASLQIKNATLVIKAEIEIMKQLTRGGDDFYRVSSYGSVPLNEFSIFRQSPPEKNWQTFVHKRKDITSKDLMFLDLTSMPGFRVSWEITGANVSDVTPLKCDRNRNLYNLFVR